MSFTSFGCTSSRTIDRANNAFSELTKLRSSSALSIKTTPKHVRILFHTFVRSKYLYAICHTPLSDSLLKLDNSLLSLFFQTVLKLSTCPKCHQIPLLCGIYRIKILPIIREDLIHQLASKIKSKSEQCKYHTKNAADRNFFMIRHRSRFNALYRAIQNSLSKKDIRRRSFFTGNTARRGRQKPIMLLERHLHFNWPISITWNAPWQCVCIWELSLFPKPTFHYNYSTKFNWKL